MKDQIFISHATPEDNDFTIWLASRLEMRGYRVWIDKERLLGGERFWDTIQKAIDSSRKVLLVYSNNIVQNRSLKRGIEDELEYAKSLASVKNDTEFVIPLHIDDSAYNLVIGLPNINHIPFNNNWAQGLAQLFKKLDKDGVQYDANINSSLSTWYESVYSTDSKIMKKKEMYYTSWWSVKYIPQTFYMYKFSNKEQATTIKQVNESIPLAQQSNIISSFDGELSFNVAREGLNFDILPQAIYSYSLEKILLGFESDSFPSHKDVENHFKDYLRYLIYEILRRKGFRKTEMANKRYAYYFPAYQNKFVKIPFRYKKSFPPKTKRKALGGKYKDKGYWHYGISVLSMLYPHIGVSIKSHLFFTSDGFKLIDNDSVQHSYRRNKGRSFFNEHWRDMLLALLTSLQGNNGKIEIPVTRKGICLEMNLWPETIWSEYGYNDPSHAMNEDDIDNLREEEESEE